MIMLSSSAVNRPLCSDMPLDIHIKNRIVQFGHTTVFAACVVMNTLIRRKSEQWLGLDRQEDRHVQYEQQ